MERDIDRAMIICCHFTRNLAYFHAGNDSVKVIEESNFWRLLNGNFAEIAVMEFCKLFGGPKERHRWQNILNSEAEFISSLEARLLSSFDDFKEYVKDVREYRDKYLSHLDAVEELHLPPLKPAQIAVFTYYDQLVKTNGAKNLPADLNALYLLSLKEAKACYPHKP